ncbi:hypothetical protein RN001_007049 [Aquatica leii]|uniref:Uncharacterized protein n=1 Tax=Aquatica leii TaxID=1421715 RepID=A0AAN7P938_9COLE|nr:hypothetical protein RN001_007049 [Aquatica leii]
MFIQQSNIKAANAIYRQFDAQSLLTKMKVIYLAFLGVNFALELPSYFPKCCLNDPNINNCILEAAMKVKPYIQNGVEELGINPLYPVVFPYFPMDHSAEHGEFLSSNKDFTIYGMNNYNVESIQFYAKEMILKGKMNFNELFVHCLYETVKGHLVNIPIEGKGIYGGLLGPINITFEINVDLIERNVVVLVISSIQAISLPPYFPKCLIDDKCISSCVVEAAKKLRPYLEQGIKELSIKPIKPTILKNFNVTHKAIDANFKGKARNFVFHGMQHYDIVDLEFHPKEVLLKGIIKFGDVHTFSDYILDGHIVSIPVTGKGDLIRVRNLEYCKLKDVKVKYKPSNYLMRFDGLQKENGPWGDTNTALKEKSVQIAIAVAPVFEEIMRTYLVNYLEWFLREVPYSKLFLRS